MLTMQEMREELDQCIRLVEEAFTIIPPVPPEVIQTCKNVASNLSHVEEPPPPVEALVWLVEVRNGLGLAHDWYDVDDMVWNEVLKRLNILESRLSTWAG